MRKLRNGCVQAATKALILLGALAVFGCRSPKNDGINMGDNPIQLRKSDELDVKSNRRNAEVLKEVPVRQAETENDTAKLKPLHTKLPPKKIREAAPIQ